MSMLSRLIQRAFVYDPVAARDPALAVLFGGNANTNAGVPVNQNTAQTLAAYYSGVQLIASTLACMSLEVIERDEDEGDVATTDHPLADLLLRAPNPLYTAFQWKERMVQDIILWGNGYNYLQYEGDVVRYIWPLKPSQITVRLNARNEKEYVFQAERPGEKTQVFREWEILHLPGYGYNGIVGQSLLTYARNSVGFSLATEQFGTSFFANNAVPGSVITHPASITSVAKKRMEGEIEDRLKGSNNGRRILVLDEGMTMKASGIPPEDGQFLQTRQFQIREVARWLRVPPHMLYDMDQQAGWTVENQGLDFLTHTISPWNDRFTGPMQISLLDSDPKYYLRFNSERLLAMDKKTRFDIYAQGRNMGVYTLNDIMRAERMPLLDTTIGDVRIGPSTMKPLGGSDPTTPIHPEALQAIMTVLASIKADEATVKGLIKAMVPSASDDVVDYIAKGAKTYEPAIKPATDGSQVGSAGGGAGKAAVLGESGSV